MTTIGARIVRKARRPRRCEECNRWIEGAHLDAYGHADDGTRPFHIRFCRPCAIALAGVTKDARLKAVACLLEGVPS